MGQGIYIDGTQVFPDPSNWQAYAKQAIDSALAANPFTDNATQLAIMNAVKESAGVVDNASPFHTMPGTVDATPNGKPPDTSSVNGWIEDNIILPIGNAVKPASDAVQTAVKNASGNGLDALTADVRIAIVGVMLLGGLFLIIYAAKAVK